MVKQTNIPRRTAQPESVSYILLDKRAFKELIANFVAAVEGQTGNKQELNIYVGGFDGSFESADDVANTLTAKEWVGLSSIRVSIRDKEKYADRLSLNFGGYSFNKEGLRMEYGNGNTDIERLAIKEKIDLFMTDYSRAVWLNDRVVSALASAMIFAAFLVWAYSSLSDDAYGKLTPWNHISLVSSAIVFGFWVYILTAYTHHKLVPHFEIVKDKGLTRVKVILRIIGKLAFIVGLASGLLALIQWIF